MIFSSLWNLIAAGAGRFGCAVDNQGIVFLSQR